MKVIKSNIVITGFELNRMPSFVYDLKNSTNKDWGFWGLKSNHKRHGIRTEILRYFLYFFYSLYILLNSRNLKNIITTQQFYGLIVAFYLRLFHLKKRFSLTVLTFIYRPKNSFLGGCILSS